MQNRSVRTGLFGCVAVLMLAAPLGTLASPAAAVTTRPPVITAKPNNVMVNQHTNLIGRGFPRFATLRLAECSKTNWVVPAKPCDKGNSILVRTDGKGSFVTGFKVEACNGARASTKGLAERCYIGVPKPSGVDTVRLVGAARIVVTFP
jgi:hypothetical protein